MPSKDKYKKKHKSLKKNSGESQKTSESIKTQVLRFIYVSQVPVTTRGVADELEISWKKAKSILNGLFRDGYLQKKLSKGGTTYWKENE